MRDIVAELEVENDTLADKIYKLECFINTQNFTDLDKTNRNLLETQLVAMSTYSHILVTRIEHIKGQ